MAYVPVPGTVEVELRMGLDGERIENTLYFNKVGAWDVPSMQALGEALISWWSASIAPQMSVALALIELFITDLTTNTSGALSVSTGLPVAGAVGLEAISSNVALCISFHTANRGRSFRGRNYLSGLPENAVNTNRVTGGVMDILRAGYNDLLDVATAQGCAWVVVSRFSGVTVVSGKRKPTPRATGLSTPILSASFTDNVVDSQRGRLPNH